MFLPLLAERFARQRLRALAKVEGKVKDGKPAVLFLCVHMGCGGACPVFPGKRYEDWTLEDPAGQDVAAVRPIGTKSNDGSGRCSRS